jgi:hypothetical protein
MLTVEPGAALVFCADDALDRREVQLAERIVLAAEQALFSRTVLDRGNPDIHHLAAYERLDPFRAIQGA